MLVENAYRRGIHRARCPFYTAHQQDSGSFSARWRVYDSGYVGTTALGAAG